MSKMTRVRYTLEFKLEAVRLVKAGQSVAAVAETLDVPAQSISNWLKADQEGKLGGGRHEAGKPGADGIVETSRRSGAAEDGARYFKKSVGRFNESLQQPRIVCRPET